MNPGFSAGFFLLNGVYNVIFNENKSMIFQPKNIIYS